MFNPYSSDRRDLLNEVRSKDALIRYYDEREIKKSEKKNLRKISSDALIRLEVKMGRILEGLILANQCLDQYTDEDNERITLYREMGHLTEELERYCGDYKWELSKKIKGDLKDEI